MAANHDVPLTLSVETVGIEEINKMQGDILALAKAGEIAAPEFQKLSNEISSLAKQGELTAQFRSLTTEVEQLKVVEEAAAANAKALKEQLAPLAVTTSELRAEEASLKSEIIDVKEQLAAKRLEIARTKNETSAAAKESSEYTNTLRTLTAEIINLKQDLAAKNTALRETRSELATAASAEKELSNEVTASTRALTTARTALEAKSTALRENNAALEAAGVSANDVASAELTLSRAYADVSTSVQKAVKTQNDLFEAQIRQEGEAKRLAAIEQEHAAQYAQWWVDALNKKDAAVLQSREAEAQLAAQSKASADAIQNAFGVVGVRSVAQVRQEIDTVRAALKTLESSGQMTGSELKAAFQKGEDQIRALEREIRGLEGTMTLADRAAQAFGTSMGQFTVAGLAANGIMFLAQKVQELAVGFVEVVVGGDKLSRAMNAIYKDTNVAASQIEYLRKASFDTGVSMGGLEKEFVKFSAAMNGSHVPLQQSNDLFLAVTKAAASLGLSAEDTAGTLNALGQMASKGTISLEELRGQIGDRLPGAMSIAANGLGITEAQLVKLIESGQLAARDFFPAFTEGLKSLHGETDGLTNSWGRFVTLLQSMVRDANAVGVLDAAFKVLAATVGGAALGFSILADRIAIVGKGIGALFAVMLGGGRAAWAAFIEDVDNSNARLTEQARMLRELLVPHQDATTAVKEHTKALEDSKAPSEAAVAYAENLTSATRLGTEAARLHNNEVLNSSQIYVQFTEKANEALRAQEQNTEALQKGAKATKLMGEEMVRLAQLSGDKLQIDQAMQAAAEANAAANERVAASQQAEVDIIKLQLVELEKKRVAQNLTIEQISTEKQALDKKLTSAQADLEQMNAQAAAARGEAQSRQLATLALEDHSKQLKGYQLLVKELKEQEEFLLGAQQEGAVVDKQLKAVREELAKATFLVSDALRDSIRNEQLSSKEKTTHMRLTEAQAQASASHYKSLADEARAVGDVGTATQYDIRAKEEQIKVMQMKLKISQLEIESQKIILDLQRKAITGTDDESNAKRKQIDIELEILKIKSAGNQAIQDQIRELERETQALRDGINVRSGNTQSLQSDTAGRNANTDAINRQTDALQRQKSVTKKTSDGFDANPDGSAKGTFTPIGANPDLMRLVEKMRDGTLTSDDLPAAQAAQKNAKDGFDWLRSMSSVNPGAVSTEAWQSTQAALEQARQVMEAIKNAQLREGKGGGGNRLLGGSSDQSSSGGYTVNVNIGGATQSIKTASQADADALANLLRQLGQAQGRSI